MSVDTAVLDKAGHLVGYPPHLDLDHDYQGQATELSLIFPLNLNPKQAQCRYEIPFGSIIRQPYDEDTYKFGRGNWPALSWCDYADEDFACTIVHTGTPGCLAQNGSISFSLLRSAIAHERPLFPAPPEPLSFDNGPHHFEFAIVPHIPHDKTWLRTARAFVNQPIISRAQKTANFNRLNLTVDQPNIVLSALKPAQNDQAVIIRLYETIGQPTQTTLTLNNKNITAHETSMDEQKQPTPIDLNKITFRPYEIKTIKLNLNFCKMTVWHT